LGEKNERNKIMFTDYAKIYVSSGKGGNGAVSLEEKSTLQQVALTGEMEEKAEMFILRLIKIATHL